MRGFRFSLRGMFVGVSLLAAGCRLTIYATPFIASTQRPSECVRVQAAWRSSVTGATVLAAGIS